METFNPEDLFKAIDAGDFDKVKNLVEKYKDIIDIKQVNENGYTFLQNALGHGSSKIIKFLIENFEDSFDIKNSYENGCEPILFEYIGNVGDDISETNYYLPFIIEKFKDDIDINQTTKDGDTAFMFACVNNLINLTKFLYNTYKDNININQVNKDGETAFMLACKYNSIDTVKFLYENFKDIIDINQTDKDGNNALMLLLKEEEECRWSMGSGEKFFDTVKFLIENFKETIHINHENKKGETILSIASDLKSIITLLTESFEDIATNGDGYTYYLKKFKTIDTIYVKIGNIVKCYTLNESIKYNGKDKIKDNKKIVLNVDTEDDYTTSHGMDDDATILYSFD